MQLLRSLEPSPVKSQEKVVLTTYHDLVIERKVLLISFHSFESHDYQLFQLDTILTHSIR